MGYLIGYLGLIALIIFVIQFVKLRISRKDTKLALRNIGISFIVFLIGCYLVPDADIEQEMLNNNQQSTELNEQQTSSHIEEQFLVDWSSVAEDTEYAFLNSPIYDYIESLEINVNENEKVLSFFAVLSDDSTDEVALLFADDLLYRFNMLAQRQDDSIENGLRGEYLGSTYDEFTVEIGVTSLSNVDNIEEWYISDIITKGTHEAPKLQK